MPFTNNEGARLYWDRKGSGSPILLIMGHRYSSRLWYPARDALGEDHQLIWFDNRGCGKTSTTGGVTVEKMARDALAVLDAAGIESAHIYGVSMGGVIALDLARQAPDRVRSLIVGCSGILSPEKPHMPKWLLPLYFLPTRLMVLLRGRGDAYGSAASPEKVQKDRAMLADDPFTKRGIAAQALAMANYTIDRSSVASMPFPALVLHGDEDSTVPFAYGEELAKVLPHARFVPLPGAGHNYFIARGDEANSAVRQFVEQVDAGTGRAE
ncbi:alpha/beta hydrolase [Stakelama sp. CBK3Z-3]|uniref:Alpha/beta hydrolase n=1 Tax=Stakelama flava TaxID=2860338 RepID=A0ABS6XIB3_9SPHN|nr:alpha/beta hydrolase [Stakelama flava]MBW4329932.1 alpha/beta hydrolase [Stakelama flava]